MKLQKASRRFKRLIIAALVAFGLGLVPRATCQASGPAPTKELPIFEVNLHKFGYERYHDKDVLWPIFTDFTDSHSVAVAWITPDNRSAATKSGLRNPTPSHLHVLLLKAETGAKQGSLDLATPSFPVRFLGLRDGKFLTCTGNVLSLFSVDLSVIREKTDLPSGACAGYQWGWLGVSPSRESLVLANSHGENRRVILIHTSTLDAFGDWKGGPEISDLSDNWLTGYCGESREVCVRGLDELWRPLRPSGLASARNWRAPARFVNDRVVVISTGNAMAVTDVDANVIFKVQLTKNRLFGNVASSRTGERFAVMEDTLRGIQSAPLDMYPFASADQIVVYSIPDHRAIYSVKVEGRSPWTPWKGHLNLFALSPEGTLLALICDDILRVYSLPKA
jgi:hypothetical protein